jgi:hypothetical protein
MPTLKTKITVLLDDVTKGTTTISTTNDGPVIYEGTIVDATANHHITPFAVTASLVKAVYILSSADIHIYTNDLSSGTPTQTFTISANHPIAWNFGDLASCPISSNITAGLYISNASGAAADIIVIVISHIS